MSSPPSTTLPGVELRPGTPPLLLADAHGDPARWAARHKDALRATVAAHGAVLVRGLGLHDTGAAAATFTALSAELMTETESFAPRHSYGAGVYSSSKWPQNQPMCMHHELSYALRFPRLMLFACLKAPSDGGATGVADATSVLDALPRKVVRRFERQGWLLTRSYNDEIGASVAQAFGTDDREAVARYCRANAIAFQWQPDGTLHTRQRRSAVVRHPISGRRCWFNQIAFLNEWTIAEEIREYLLDTYGADGLPFNTRYGNGDPLDQDVVELVNTVYQTHTARAPWQDGDLMVVDNIRTAHSREPFDGPRDVLVAMADPIRLSDCSPSIEVTTP
ncbi:TauD/TfdA family dioxygenase [Streptomyces lunalinharesii]|uniref:TauD/TfdA family dioxygenase n=1 Tax=Streptomyces lunalinharesii TaxID=333384 RepID=A0ABN3T855_9ACTN